MAQAKIPHQIWLFRLQQAATFLFLLYVLFLLGRSAWKNTQMNQKLTNLRAEIAELKTENNRLANLIVYQQTDTFKELEARRKLGVKRPGELVIALPPEPTKEEITRETTKLPAHPAEHLAAWWQYFTD